jgi:prophage antirepressor-like protein
MPNKDNPTTSSAITPFEFEGDEVRIIRDDKGEPWFVANDVCKVLEIGNPRQALSRLDDDEKGDVILNDAIGRPQSTNTVNEYGLYSLILSSRKKEAKTFKRWVTHEVLPSIRKTGQYSVKGLRTSEQATYEGVKELIAIATDYDKDSQTAQTYFATVQNKLLYAVTDLTAADLIATRADHMRENMGLTTWKGSHILQADALVGKNYLNETELSKLHHLSAAIHSMAKLFYERGNTMSEWVECIDSQIITARFNLLMGKGRYSREKAEQIARREYTAYKAHLLDMVEQYVQLRLI